MRKNYYDPNRFLGDCFVKMNLIFLLLSIIIVGGYGRMLN